jgi:hypothetical protein
MILSFRHRFLFVRGLKVGGTSVEIALSTLCGPQDISPPIVAVDERLRQEMGGRCGNYSDTPVFEQAFVKAILAAAPDQFPRLLPPPSRYSTHMSVTEVEAEFGRPLDDFQIVGVERDPYAKVISWLHMEQNFPDYRAGTQGDMATAVEDLSASLDRAIADDSMRRLKTADFYGGRTPRVLHYEALERDLAVFAAELGVAPPPLPHAKRGPLSNGIDPTAVFRPDQIAWLNAYFAAEFTAFGYTPR